MRDYTVIILPFEIDVEVSPGITVLDAVKQAGLPIQAGCGGEGSCGDCVVRILEGDYERQASAALPGELVSQGYALACRTEIRDDLKILLPEFQELAIRSGVETAAVDEGEISGFYEVDPPVKVLEVTVDPPTLEDHSSDLKRLERAVRAQTGWERVGCSYAALKKLAGALRADGGRVRIVVYAPGSSRMREEAEIVEVVAHHEPLRALGLACDIGTSTVAVQIVDLESGEVLGSASSLNQQVKCGEDIISRIHYARKPGRLEELHTLVIGTINRLLGKAAEAGGVSAFQVYYASLAGNTTMLHLFLNIDPGYIREEPYVPTVNQAPEVLGRDVGLAIHPEGRVFFAPAVGSYVGGDITAGLLGTPMLRGSERVSMFLDAGTNGELVVGNRDWLITCACSAGPAFEGSGISCGMPATEGAIEKMVMKEDGAWEYGVIGGGKPKGICGSGLVDLLAELYVNGYVDRQGRFDAERCGGRLVEAEGGRPGYRVERGEGCFWGKDLVIGENDVANLIRSKGAVFSACALLLKNVGLTWENIEAFYVAGGFGRKLDAENAVRIGMLPDLDRGRFRYLGNSSLTGAYLVLLSERNRRMAGDLAQNMTYVELNAEAGYMNEYTGALFLPHTDMRLFPSVARLRK